MTWVLLAASYLLGATPTSYLAGRALRGIDLRQHGSGNLGATNAFRVMGWKGAVPALFLDIFKGWAPVALFPLWDGSPRAEWALAYGAAAIVGHVYSVYVRFRGGKGVATSAGVLLALAPWGVLAGAVVWGLMVFITRIVSVSSILAAVVVPVAVYFTNGPGMVLWLTVAVALFVIFAHRSNIGRLLRGEEHRFGRRPGEAP
ncbi:MAG TPA: glycerol-3-phosphate 1-O-acyltransferase PlsY [Longimicrobiales bacterium]|nr:glycerol-3-phosphate 1-O-acyltransferase PlsY [Longimicrobiales bacterium]